MRIKVFYHRQYCIDFPVTDAELNLEMRKMGIYEKIPKCKVVEVLEKNNPLELLAGNVLNLDEVNFFARRMESLTEYEREVLSVYTEIHGADTVKDLINLTYSTKGLSLITDFSDPEQVGKRLYMDEMQVLSEEEKHQINFVQFAEKTIQESSVELKPYGVFIEHGFELQEIYNGKTFPEYFYSDKIVAAVEVKNESGDTDYLYLPADICSMDKLKKRLNERYFCDLKVTAIHNMHLPETLVPTPQEIADIGELTSFNELCHEVSGFGKEKMERLAMAVKFTGFHDYPEVTNLAKHLSEFEIHTNVHNDEEYGKYLVKESGSYQVDEALLPYIDYKRLAGDRKAEKLAASRYMEDGFIGAARPLQEYRQYDGEFADPLEELEWDYDTFYLFSPLSASLMVEGEDAGILSGSDLTQYTEEIMEAIAREESPGEETRGLMRYFDRSRAVARNVLSAYPKVTEINGELYGALMCKIMEPLTEEEIDILKDYWTGQMSDGWGEGFEQHPIDVGDGEIYVSFWSGADYWRVMTEEELMGGQAHGMDLTY